MEKCLIFDLQFGASGDMLLGSLIDLGLDFKLLLEELNKIKLSGWQISPEKIVKNSISGTSANVSCNKKDQSRNLQSISKLIRESTLSNTVIENILKIFKRLAVAEAAVHGKNIEDVHFHEIGAVDSIVDISAFCISIEILKINKIYFNEIYLGSGIINSAHGEIPVPAPAVIELAKDYKVVFIQRSGEVITPTAAAILITMGSQLKEPFSFEIVKNGTGFGTRKYSFPSYTRVFLGNYYDEVCEQTDFFKVPAAPDMPSPQPESESGSASSEVIIQIECNIDDMNPQIYPYLAGILFDNGALDVYLSEIIMKKGRPGILLTVLAEPNKINIIKNVIYKETTTIGLRIFKVLREKLRRDFEKICLYNHEVRIKIAYLNNTIVNIHPEFDDCMKIAVEMGKSVQEMLDLAKNIYLNRIK